MIPPKFKRPLRHIALVALVVVFPLLYVGAVTLENDVVTGAALATAGATAFLAALAY